MVKRSRFADQAISEPPRRGPSSSLHRLFSRRIAKGSDDEVMGIRTLRTASARPVESDGNVDADVDPPVRRRTAWTVITGAVGAVVGVAPHILHHAGPLVGTALVAGAGGTALFGIIGLVASVPMLIKLRRRFSSWWAPGIALGLFSAMFLISSFVIGPLISAPDVPAPPGVTGVGHDAHHQP